MAEVLSAALQLELGSFLAALTQAQSQVQAFAQQAATALGAVTNALNNVTRATQGTTQATQQATQTFNTYNQTVNNATNVINSFNTATQNAARGTSALTSVMQIASGIGLATTIGGIISALKNFAIEAVNVAVKMESLNAAFRFLSGSAQGGAATLNFLRETANRIGLDFLTTAQAFKNFEAATRGTRLEGDKAREIFVSFSEASRVLGLSTQETTRIFLALEQMISKGKVSREELQRQLGNALPGAMQIAARSVGATTEAFQDMLTAGVESTRFVEKFAAQVKKELGQGIPDAADKAQASFARFANNMRDLSVGVGQAILTILKPALDAINAGFDLINKLNAEAAKARQQGVGPEPAAPRSVGGPVSDAQLTDAFDALQKERKRLQEMNQELRNADNAAARLIDKAATSVGLEAPSVARQARVDAQIDKVKELTKAYSDLVKRQTEYYEAEAASGTGPLASNRPFNAQQEQTKEVLAQMRKDMEAIQVQFKNFPASMDDLDRAKAQLKEVEKVIEQISGTIAKSANKNELTKVLGSDIAKLNTLYKETNATVDRLTEAEKARKKAEREAEADTKRLANERERSDEQLTEKLIDLRNDEFEAERQQLDKVVAHRQSIGADATLTAAFYAAERQKILEKEVKAAVEMLEEEQEARDKIRKQDAENAERIEAVLRETGARTTKTQTDDIAAAFAKRRELFVTLHADETQIAQLAANEQAQIARIGADEAAKEAAKLGKAYEQLVEDIARPIQSVFEGILNGTGNLLDSLKQLFFKFLAELAARALTTQIVIPLLFGTSAGSGGTGSAGGLFGVLGSLGIGSANPNAGLQGPTESGATLDTASTTQGVLGALGFAQQGLGIGSAASGALGGPTLRTLGSSLFSGTQLGTTFSGLGSTTLFGGQAGLQGATQSGVPLASGFTLGAAYDVFSGVGTGVAVGLLLKELNTLIGIEGQAGTILAGAGGGAVGGALIGTAVFPGLGTAIGAIAGTLGGALIAAIQTLGISKEKLALFGGFTGDFGPLLLSAIFGSNKPDPSLQFTELQTAQSSFDPLTGLQLTTPFAIESVKYKDIGKLEDFLKLQNQLTRGVNELFQAVIDSFTGLAPQIQRGLVEPLNAIFANVTADIEKQVFKGDKLGEQLGEFFGTKLPASIEEQINPVIASIQTAVKQISPVVDAFNDIIRQANEDIVQLAQQAAQQHVSLQGTIVALQQGLFSPVEQFAEAQDQFRRGIELLEQATPSQRIQLIPQLQELAQQIFSFGKSLEEAETVQRARTEQAIVGIQQGLLSPAQQFVASQRELRENAAVLSGLSPAQRAPLLQDFEQLASQVFTLGKNEAVLGQDPQAVRALQAELVGLLQGFLTPGTVSATGLQSSLTDSLQGLQGTSANAFGSLTNVLLEQQTLANAQITALVDALANPAGVPEVIQGALAQLQQIQAALEPFSSVSQQDQATQVQNALLTGSVAALTNIDATQREALAVLQTIANSLIGAPGRAAGINYVANSGINYLHQGERVVNAEDNARGGGGGDIIINVNGAGGSSDALVDRIIQKIEQKSGRLQGGRIMVKN